MSIDPISGCQLINDHSVFLIVLTIFITASKKINKSGPSGSPVLDAFRTIGISMKEGSLERAKPSALSQRGHLEKYELAHEARYTDSYVDAIKSGFGACKVCQESRSRGVSLLMRSALSSASILLSLLDSDLQQFDITSW